MIRVETAGSALAELRVSISPLWELLGSVSALTLGRVSPWPYSDWRRSAERALLDRRCAELVTWTRRLGARESAVLTPVPEGPDNGIEDELKLLFVRLQQLPEQRLAELAANAGAVARPGIGGWMEWLSDALLGYWEAALAPYWPAMHAALREDVLARGRVLTGEGTGGLLSRLDQRVRWTPPVLELPAALPSGNLCCDGGLVLVPLIFGRRATRCVPDGAGRVAISYQSHGSVVLGRAFPPENRKPDQPWRGDRLVLLLGRGKAAVLRALREPGTTSDLADALGMSASTISQHLSTLLAAGVVHKRRAGVRVMYALEQSGAALLRHADGESRPSPE